MNTRIAEIQETIAAALNALPDVFSTVQWGGRAYKLPGPNGNRRKPKLLAHMWLNDDGSSVGLAFKLNKKRADEVIDRHDWISPHSFRTLAPSGWVTANVRSKSQARTTIAYLIESYDLHPVSRETPARRGKPRSESECITRRIEVVLREKRASGWYPDS